MLGQQTTVQNAVKTERTVADPNAEYETLKDAWKRARAFCSGERFVKALDAYIDRVAFRNILIPFSPSMTQPQYDFYRAEAELPGIVAEFSKMLIGGLLRKQASIEFPDNLPEGAEDWIKTTFNQDDTSLMSFLDQALAEEIPTSRAWVYVDYPEVLNAASLTPEETADLKPYPILWPAETVINWTKGKNKLGKVALTRVITRGYEERFESNEFHPDFIEVIKVHEMVEGYYQIRVFETPPASDVKVVAGQQQKPDEAQPIPVLVKVITNILMNGKRLEMIPAWPLNGQIDPEPPMLNTIIDKEVALYNKLSRRNHLLYGASTYTPVISADISDSDFKEIVDSGLGTWLRLPQGGTASVLETPTAALADMEAAITLSIEEMAKLGIRMLSPETQQSGVALDIRNAAQTARLGNLSSKISATMGQIITFMLKWRYNIELNDSDIVFKLSEDFNPTAIGADWLRLATEWFQQGLIPRSVWVQLLKQNDMVPPEYDDEKGLQEITDDRVNMAKTVGSEQYAQNIMDQSLGLNQYDPMNPTSPLNPANQQQPPLQ